MTFIFQPWQLLFIILAGWVNREQQETIEYLRTENQILREKLGKTRILLSDEQRRLLVEKANGAPLEVTLTTAFKLDDHQRDSLAAELRVLLEQDMEVRFERSPELVCGIALDASGRRLSWNVESSLEGLSSTIAEALAGMDNAARER